MLPVYLVSSFWQPLQLFLAAPWSPIRRRSESALDQLLGNLLIDLGKQRRRQTDRAGRSALALFASREVWRASSCQFERVARKLLLRVRMVVMCSLSRGLIKSVPHARQAVL